jgi:hypothetical protein
MGLRLAFSQRLEHCVGMSAPRLAFISFPYYKTYASMSQYSEAAVLGAAFAALGARLDLIDGLDAGIDWRSYDAVLPLGCWGYHEDAASFRAFIAGLTAAGVRLCNAPQTLLWNLDKSYLLDLSAAGVETATFRHFPAGSQPDVAAELKRLGWERYVLKPTISGNAEDTRVGHGPPDADMLALAGQILGRSGLLMQPFFEEIPRDGEWSLLFFGGVLSHAVIKVPKPGDFRSQPDHGATVRRVEPPPAVVAQAAAAVRLAPGGTVYARVDGFILDGRLQLVELELIEPHLFLDAVDKDAPTRFAAAVLAALDADAAPNRIG